MRFVVSGLDPAPFEGLHALPDAELGRRGARRVRVEIHPSAPCRVSLDDAEIGEAVILLNFVHQPAQGPYHQQGPIFVRKGVARMRCDTAIPPALTRRVLSLRGFDAQHIMAEADLVEGADAPALIGRIFENRSVQYIHAYYAKRGCYAALIERA